jgi:hypothetical protein
MYDVYLEPLTNFTIRWTICMFLEEKKLVVYNHYILIDNWNDQ